MINKISVLAILFLFVTGIQAQQIDRSKQPEPGPAPKINLNKPATFNLKNGLKVMVVENHKLPRVSMTLTMDNPPHTEGDKSGASVIMGGMLGEGTKDIPKDKFNEEIDYLGANVNFNSKGASANTLSKYFPRVMELMAKGALNPVFTQEEFEKQKERSLEGLKASEKDVAQNARRISQALAYGKDHPYGEFISEETVSNLELQDIKDYYGTYFVPQNAYLVVVGDVKVKEVKKLAKKYFGDWKKKELKKQAMPEVNNVAETQVNFIDFPNAVQSEVQVTNTFKLKKGDPDYFPAIIANKILGGGGEARLFLNLREDKGYTYGAYSRTGDDKYVARFTASASVRNAVTDSAVVAFLDELHRIRNEKVSAEELKNAKAKYTGDFVLALENPATIARYALEIETENLPEDFYETYLKKINAVTAEDIQRVAQKYFKVDNARIVVVGKGSEVLENLEKLTYKGKKIPVKYFDKNANPSEKPEYKKDLSGITVEEIFERYVEALGGMEAIENVETVHMIASAKLQGQQLDLETKTTASGKSINIVSMAGNVMQKQVFDGENGYVEGRGQKMPMNEEQKEMVKVASHPFPEMLAVETELKGIESVNDKDAYVVKMNENVTNYYGVESGLKLRTVQTVKQGPQTMNIPIDYSDYKEVSGVKFPHAISQSMGAMTLNFEVSNYEINSGVSESDFK